MNTSATNGTVVLPYQDSLAKAVLKNVIVLVLGISITGINMSAIYTFCKNQIFYTSPRYILFIHLVINDMVQVTMTVVLFVTSYTVYRIHASLCCVLVLLAVFTSQNTPLCLACMAVECYIAVLAPLHHTQICTVRRTLAAMCVLWAITAFSAVSDLFITIAMQPSGFFLSRMFCLKENIFPSLLLLRKRDITYGIFLVVVWITIFYTYFRILLIAKEVSQEGRRARNTLILHGVQVLLSMTSYMIPQVQNKLQKWFPKNQTDLRFAFYIFIQILPRSLTPVLYGLRDNTFRKRLKGYFCIRVIRK